MNKETIKYLKENNKNMFGYEQDKIISFDDAQEIVEHLEAFENRKIKLERENYQLQKELDKKNKIIEELKKWLKSNDIHFAEAIPFRETLRFIEELEKGSEE